MPGSNGDRSNVTVLDPMVCSLCGRLDGDVRLCCWRSTAERTCRSCYISGKGAHSAHIGPEPTR